MTGEERSRILARVLAARDAGAPLAAACASAGVSEATARRWMARAPDRDPALLADAPRSGRPRLEFSEAAVEYVRGLYLRSNLRRGAGSAPVAWRWAARDKSSPLTDAERAAILGRGRGNLPASAREACREVAPAAGRYRDPRKGAAADGIMAPGWLRMLEDGSRRLLPGERQVWDDASVNVGVCVPWNRGGDPCSEKYGVRVARFQLLAGIDCATDFCVGTGYVMRASDAYRAEDVVRVMHRAWSMAGYAPRKVVLEGGAWQAERTLSYLEAAGVGVASAKGRPNQKLVEGWFNRLWTAMSVALPPDGQLGRFRGEMRRENALWAACREGRRDPRGVFPDLATFLRCLDRAVEFLNSERVVSREYGGWIPAEAYAGAAANGLELPGWLWRRALPVAEWRKVRRQGLVTVAAECPFGWTHEYVFALADGWRHEGEEALVQFDPWRVRLGARVELRGGEVLDEAAPCVSPAPDPDSPRMWIDGRAAARGARARGRAAAAEQVAAYDARGTLAREAATTESPEVAPGLRGGIPEVPPPADPEEAAREDAAFAAALAEAEEAERRLRFA